ncbi:hypothetical protein HanIR_Chr08g0357671 [Helianthus annuus]|nr:hypothetical protein HanIR_Chr08g0357671 [Helianthus annuus]
MIRLKAWPPPVTGETLAKFFQKSNTWKYFYHKCYKHFSFTCFQKYKFRHDFYYKFLSVGGGIFTK